MDLYIMRFESSGFVETPYMGSLNIEEEFSSRRITPYFYSAQRTPIEFTVQFVLVDKYMRPKKWTPQEKNKIARWLIHDTYKEFRTSDDLGKIYYAIVNPERLFLINSEGYAEVVFRTNSPYAWTPVYEDRFDLSNNASTEIIEIENKSNVLKYFNPLIEIELVNDETGVQLKNLSNGGKVMKFEGLNKNETISIDCQNKIIKSNLFDSNPFTKFNVGMTRYWMDLVYGVNRIEVAGQCRIRIKCQFPIAQ